MLKHVMLVDKIHEIISFKQSRWLKKYISFVTQKKAKNGSGKVFYKLLNNGFYGKDIEIVRNRLRLELIKKFEYNNFMKQFSKLTFNGIHMSIENCDS